MTNAIIKLADPLILLAIDGVEFGTIWGLEQAPTLASERAEFGGQAIHPFFDPETNPYWGLNNTGTREVGGKIVSTVKQWFLPEPQSKVIK